MNPNPHPQLDRLLAAVGGLQPDESFEQRVLRGIAARQAAPKPERTPGLLWSLALTSAVAVALIVATALRHDAQPMHPANNTAEAVQPETPQSTLPIAPATTHPRLIRAHATTLSPERQALLISFPAPEAPLTEQEKLLLKIAHTGDSQEFTTLNPEARSKLHAQQDSDTKEFFDVQKPVDYTEAQLRYYDKGDGR